MLSKKLSCFLAVALSLLTLSSPAVCRARGSSCRGGSCKKVTVVRTCRGSSCKKAPARSCSGSSCKKSTTAKRCSSGSCKTTSTCPRRITTQSKGCCRKTTPTVIYKKCGKSGCRKPLAPGKYHFERKEYTNGLDRISVPFPSRSRTR